MNQLIINPIDNVAVITDDQHVLPMGHKIALRDISKGDYIIKYGNPIGIATDNIAQGEHVHSHNMKTTLDNPEVCDSLDQLRKDTVPETPDKAFLNLPKVFNGYRRKNGKVGVRNEIWIIPTVGCIVDVASAIKSNAEKELADEILRFTDGVFSFSHPYGCSQLGDDELNTEKILAGLATHPNAGGVLLVGLGCENSGIEKVISRINNVSDFNIKTLICQDCDDEIHDGVSLIRQLIENLKKIRRESCPISDLTIGVKCGGSDGMSGITANPLVGRFSDALIKFGGSILIAEIPEMFGAEHILLSRCESREAKTKLNTLLDDFKNYYLAHGFPISGNPSPGNHAGGITTLEEKSLGCTQKAGISSVVDVLSYGESATRSGLSVVWGPGNDLVSTTSLAISGAQIILFTTGRGTPYGSAVPTIKISSNTKLANSKPNWVDFDSGILLTSEDSDPSFIDASFFNSVLSVASGEQTASEKMGYKQIAIFKTGVTL